MARLISGSSLLQAAFFAAAGVLACACLSGTAALAQRGGGHVGGVAHIGGGARIAPPSTFLRRPFYPIRPVSPVFLPPSFGFWGGPYFRFGLGLGFSPLFWQNCYLYGTYGCYPVPAYYLFAGEGRELAQLLLTDGTAYNVTDYWLVDTQLHFKTIEDDGTKVVEHAIDFNQLDLQKTIDVNTQRGFRFVLRNEPIEQYLQDHPEIGSPAPLQANPPAAPPPASPAPRPPQ